jgi:hypothetical protein
MKHKYIILAALAAFSLISCDDREVFEKEQYKNIFGFVSESDNTKKMTVSLHKEKTTTYMSFSMGGTKAPKNDVNINIVLDTTLVDDYNQANYDVDVSKYSVVMPSDKYEISSMSCTIKAGEVLGTIPVIIYPEGLSPDKDYIIPVRVLSYEGAELRPDKSSLLLRIAIKNQWSNSSGIGYQMVGNRKLMPDGSPINMPGTKTVHCWTANSVRMMPGNETFSKDKHVLEAKAMIATIDTTADAEGYHKVTLSAYRDLNVQQIDGDPDYPNVYGIIDDGFNTYKTFLLHYYYQIGDEIYEMREETRYLYTEDEDVDEGFTIIDIQEQ